MKVLVTDGLSPEGIEILKQAPDLEVEARSGLKPEELKAVIGGYEGLIIRSATKVTADVLEKAERLRVVGRAGVGVDNVDVPAATQRGVVVMNTPGGNSLAAAELTIAMMLALSRHLPQATASVRAGKWEKNKFMGTQVSEKTLGIVGLGNIGRLVAERALGLKMSVIAYDPFVTKEAGHKIGVELKDLDEVFARSDYLTLHIPKTEETRNLIRAETIARMKPGVRIINCARGELVNEADLAAALKSGRVAGAAVDVFSKEPPGQSPLFECESAIFTPHLGASTDEAQASVAVAIAEQVADYLVRGTIRNAVNFPSVSGEVMIRIRPYLNLAERMGSLLGQMLQCLDDVTLEYSGEVAKYDTRPVTHAALKGLIQAHLDIPINYVNAPAYARQRGIKVIETTTEEPQEYTSLITMKVHGQHAEAQEIAGTLFGKQNPRIVRVGGIILDAVPEGSVLVIRNHDKPGVIGNLGATLGKSGINIGQFKLGRLGGQALCMVNVDEPAPEAVLEELRKLPNIISVQQVKLD